MIMKLHQDEYAWFQAHPMVWWAAAARWAFGRVAAGIPGIETDDKGNETGYVLFSHPDIDHRDLHILAVCLAGKAFAEAEEAKLEGAGEYLVAVQAQADYDALLELQAVVLAGKLSMADAVERIWQYVLTQGETLGVKYVEPVEDEIL